MDEKQAVSPDYQDAAKLAEQFLPANIETTAEPALIMVSGLPGTGKSYLSRLLAERLPAVIVESDRVRKTLFVPPTYSAEESALVHRVCRMIVRQLLARGANVIYDATNLVESQRELIYQIADRMGSKLVIVQTVAPEEVVRERLDRRQAERDARDMSDADWRVYQSMRQRIGKDSQFRRNYAVVNTAEDTEAALAKVLRVIRKTGVRKR